MESGANVTLTLTLTGKFVPLRGANMKMLRVILSAICVLSAVNSMTNRAVAQWAPGQNMARSMIINLALGKSIEENTDLGFCDICYLGAFIAPGGNSFITMELEEGRKYVFAGAVQEDCDLDILVQDSNGNTLAKDSKTDNIPVAEFTPTQTDRYTIRLALYSAPGSRFCGMVLLRDKGWSIPLDNLGTAGSTILSRCDLIAAKKPTRFLQESGEWAIIGQVLEKGESSGLSDMNLGTGRRVLIAGGDNHTRDLDLTFSRNDSANTKLAEDTQDDDAPLVTHFTKKQERYSVEITNARSTGTTVAMIALLELEEE
jgi:hypothetical protein